MFARRRRAATIGRVRDLEKVADEVIDLLFDLMGDNVGKSLDWLYGYNTALNAVPVDLMLNGEVMTVQSYLRSIAEGS